MRLKDNNNPFIHVNPPYQLMVIHSSKLVYPRELYQRGVERKRVELIAAHFNEYVANEPKVSFRNGQFIVEPLNAPHRVQGKTGTDSIIHPVHFLRGEVSEEFQHPAFVYGKDLLCLNDGRNGEKLVHQQAAGRLGILFCRLACQCGYDQRGRVKISHIVLENDCRTIPALL